MLPSVLEETPAGGHFVRLWKCSSTTEHIVLLAALLRPPPPLLVCWPISSYLLFAGRHSKPSSHDVCRCVILKELLLPHATTAKAPKIKNNNQPEMMRGNGKWLWSPPAEPFLIRGCLANCLSFPPVVCPICTHLVKLIRSHYFFLTRQVDVPVM